MIESKRKEEISLSYLNAICAFVGIGVTVNKHDDDGIDVFLQKIISLQSGGKLNTNITAQLKSTSQQLVETDEIIRYQLKVKNYNDLCRKSTSQQLLFVLVLPNEEAEWIKHNVDELVIKKCMYWVDLSNNTESTNVDNITIELSKKNYVSSETLIQIFEKVAEEGHL